MSKNLYDMFCLFDGANNRCIGLRNRAAEHLDIPPDTLNVTARLETSLKNQSPPTYSMVIFDGRSGDGNSMKEPTKDSPATVIARRIFDEHHTNIVARNRPLADTPSQGNISTGQPVIPYIIQFRDIRPLQSCADMEFPARPPPPRFVRQIALRPDGTTKAFDVPEKRGPAPT